MLQIKRVPAIALLAVIVSSCGSSGGGSSPSSTPAPPPPIQVSVSGLAAIKVQSGTHGIGVLEQRLTAITDQGPDRALAIFDATGAASGRFSPPAGFSLIDFAQHPSGEISVALATATGVRLARIDRAATVIDMLDIVDPQAATDPFFDTGGIHDDTSLLPIFTRDAVRVAAVGEDLVMALRTGRNATVAYRFAHARPGGFTRTWRTLAEPGFSVFAIGITSGTLDTFDALINHWQVRLDADGAGNLAIGAVSKFEAARLFEAHSRYFGDAIASQEGVLVTRIGADGTRLGAIAIDTVQDTELHGVRIAGDDIVVMGRVYSVQRADGGGWNAYWGRIGKTSGALAAYRTVDIDLGEILFDAAPLAQGGWLVAGSAGYTQNPTGASVSEQAAPLLAILENDGTLRQRIAFASGPRQNQLRSLAPLGSHWLVGGMVNGPGTHSGDGDRTLITADGFARETALP
jgi:hypothetical protein